MLLGFAAFYFAAQMLSAFALRFTPMTDLEQCVSAARRLLDANQPGLSERQEIRAGDSFIAGFLTRRILGDGMEDALRFAATAAANTCKFHGGFGYPHPLD